MRFSVNFFQVRSPIAFFLTFSSSTHQDTHVDNKSSSLRALTCEKIALLTKTLFYAKLAQNALLSEFLPSKESNFIFLTFSSPTHQDTHVDTKSSSLRALTCEKIAMLTKTLFYAKLAQNAFLSEFLPSKQSNCNFFAFF